MAVTMNRRRDGLDEQVAHFVGDIKALRHALRDGVSREAIVHELDRILRELDGPRA